MQRTFILTPRDVLFMRDARPMEASDAGLGANWPRPDQLYAALHHAFLKKWPERQTWEGEKHTFRDKDEPQYKGRSKDKNENSSCRFGALKTVGPFPKKAGALYFPCPRDLGMKLIPVPKGQADLPAPLTHAFCMAHQSKVKLPTWISSADYENYFSKQPGNYYKKEDEKMNFVAPQAGEIFEPDRNIGIAIDPETGTAEDHQLYQAEYLRLHPDTDMVFSAECEVIQRGSNGATTDVLDDDKLPEALVFGGQQGVAYIKQAGNRLKLPKKPDIHSQYLRWTLLTPALFKSGWLPGWIENEGQVMLKVGADKKRQEGESRLAWRERIKQMPSAKGTLIAACIGKPEACSGWNQQAGGPKPTFLAVPAGSCYVFDCGTKEDAMRLSKELNLKPLSDQLGEKGFGIGICSSTTIEA